MRRTTTLVSLLAAFAIVVEAQVPIDFTSDEGYADGVLAGQNGWTGAAAWTVDASETETVSTVTTGAKITYGGSPLNPRSGTITYAQNFNFDYTPTGVAGTRIYEVFRMNTEADGTLEWLTLYLQEAASGNYNFRIRNQADALLGSSDVLVPADIGLDDDTATDDLRVVWNLTRGTDETTWSSSVVLKNLTTGQTVDIGFGTAVWNRTDDISVPLNLHDDSSVFIGFTSQDANGVTVYSCSAGISTDSEPNAINFNTAEGYVFGTIHDQKGWTGSTAWGVDTDDTTLFNAAGPSSAVYYGGNSLNPEDGVLVYTQDFTFNYTSTGVGNDILDIFRIASDTSGTDFARLQLRELPSGYHLRFRDGFTANLASSVAFTAADLGLDDDDQADELRVTLMAMRGATNSDWSLDVILVNKTTGKFVHWNPKGLTVAAGLHSDIDIFFGVVAEQSNRYTIRSLSFGYGPDKIDFTATEGYVTGALNSQNNWTASGGIQVSVDPLKEWLYLDGGSGQNAVYGGVSLNPQAGTITYSQDFKFNYDEGGTEDVYNVFKLDSDLPADVARIYFRYNATSELFSLRYSTGNGFDQNLKSSNTFLPSAIGLDGGSTTDDLRLTWSLTRGETATTWTLDVTLVNLTTGSAIDVGYGASNWTPTVTVNDGFHTDTSIEFGVSSPGPLTSAFIFNISFSQGTEALLPSISMSQSGGDIFITYEGGVLQYASDPTTNWNSFDPQPASPYQYTLSPAENRFFRVVK